MPGGQDDDGKEQQLMRKGGGLEGQMKLISNHLYKWMSRL
jgi:hypothetical protein